MSPAWKRFAVVTAVVAAAAFAGSGGLAPTVAPAYRTSAAAFARRPPRDGQPVYVSLPLPPLPTDAPGVWEYRPGRPAEHFAPTIRIRLSRPGDPPRKVHSVFGITAGRELHSAVWISD